MGAARPQQESYSTGERISVTPVEVACTIASSSRAVLMLSFGHRVVVDGDAPPLVEFYGNFWRRGREALVLRAESLEELAEKVRCDEAANLMRDLPTGDPRVTVLGQAGLANRTVCLDSLLDPTTGADLVNAWKNVSDMEFTLAL